MVERLKFYMEKKELLPSQFADALGMPRSSFSQLMNGRNKSISDATIGKIHVAFPDLSIQWLLFGEGEMMAQHQPSASSKNQQSHTHSTPQQPELSFFDENAIFEQQHDTAPKYEQEIEVEKITTVNDIDEILKQTATTNHRAIAMHNRAATKKIVKIMVFYNDNTFESFKPE